MGCFQRTPFVCNLSRLRFCWSSRPETFSQAGEIKSTVEVKSGEGGAGVEVGSFQGEDVGESQMSFPISLVLDFWGGVFFSGAAVCGIFFRERERLGLTGRLTEREKFKHV